MGALTYVQNIKKYEHMETEIFFRTITHQRFRTLKQRLNILWSIIFKIL